MPKGVADVVFLIDSTQSMSELMPGLKENISHFVDYLEAGDGQEVSPVKDWRARILGYRDFEVDPIPYVENPFVRDRNELKQQLNALEPSGGGDEPECLLDALHKTISIGETGKQETEDPQKWRYHSVAARVVVVMTDASFKRSMVIPAAAGGSVDDIITLALTNHISLSIFAPEDAEGDTGGYSKLAEADKAEWMPVARGLGLREFTSDRKNFQETLKQLAKTISQTAEVLVAS